jgi:uncharacterized protein YggE
MERAMNLAKLGIEVDASNAVEALKALAEAAEHANAALEQLAGKEHGGLTIKIAGGVGLVEIKPKS